MRSGPRSIKMWLGPPPSEVTLAKLLRDIFLARVITPLTPATTSEMNVSFMRCMLPRSARIIMPSATPRSQSKALSMKTEKLQSMRAASNLMTLGFGIFSTWTGTIQSISTKGTHGGKWVNWDWMTNKRHTIFNQIKATCDELEMTKMMSFKYDWNKEIICHFYATLYFDAMLRSSCGCLQGRSMRSLSEALPVCLGLSTSLRCHQRLGFTLLECSSWMRCSSCMLPVQRLIRPRC
jgi:hypothetical protein